MNLYHLQNSKKENIAIIQFGIGLLGSAIKNKIEKGEYFKNVTTETIGFNWRDTNEYEHLITVFFQKYKEVLQSKKKVYIIWSAGKAGFHAEEEQVDEQFIQFKLVNRILSREFVLSNIQTQFILLSSAGGLFEGQVAVNEDSQPLPLRPYGKLKLNEENYIKENNLYNEIQILRISSVYSIEVLNKRKGLIQVLMENGLQNRVSYIFGNESTLRDYVLDEDIASFIANSIYTEEFEEINFIVSGKPSSIFEIRKSIEKVLGKRLYTVYSTIKTNSLNISFTSSVVAKKFVSSQYIANLRLHYQKLNS